MEKTIPYQIVEHQYTIHDRPDDRQPIRRLQTEGAEVLEVNELLQIALGRVDGFEEIVNKYGVSFLTTLQSVNDIVEILHVDHLQATRLLAILGLGKKLYTPSQGALPYIRGIEDVYANYRTMANLAREQLRLLLIDSRYKLSHDEVLAIGSTEHLSIPVRDILQPAVERRVSAIILVHNHPTGDPTPSESDLSFTETIRKAALLLDIELLDHVIIAQGGYRSCMLSNQHDEI